MKVRLSKPFKRRYLEVRCPITMEDGSGGELDEVVGTGQFHLEQMDDTHWSLGLRTKSGDLQVVLWATRARVYGIAHED